MKRTAILLALLAAPAAAQICGPVYVRDFIGCPAGTTAEECVEWPQGPLTGAMVEQNYLNVLALCRAGVGPSFGVIDPSAGTNPTATVASDTLVVSCSGLTCSGAGKTLTLTVSGAPPTGAAGGDLGGTYPSPTVADDSHAHTSATLPAASTTGAGLVELATSAESTAGLAVQANDPRLIGPNSVTLGTDTVGGYAGSASEAGPAATALALNANPPPCDAGKYMTDTAADGAPTCAQVAYSQISGAPAAGIVGSLGSTDNSVPRTVGAGGATLEGTGLTVDDANNVMLAAGASLQGSDNYVRVRTPGGGYNLGNGTFQDSSGAGRSWLINLGISATAAAPVWSGTNDPTTGSGNCASGAVCLTASGVESLRATTTAVKVLTLQLVSSDSAPYACDAGAAGSSYYDTTGDDTFCDCMGAGWVMRYPLQTGANCS